MWKFLSYTLTKDLSAYKNGKRINIIEEKSINNGSSCNQSRLELSTHLGTHVDFPFHFYAKGKKGEQYQAQEFIFNSPDVIFLENAIRNETLIEEHHFNDFDFKSDTDLFIIKTGFCDRRFDKKYYNNYPGFSEKLAKYFRNKMTKLKAIGFDLISLSSPHHGEIGKRAHHEFLKKEKILIIEDMDLRSLDCNSRVNTVIVAPLRFDNSDGSPATIFYNSLY